jgi:hypothetical protein
VTADRTSADARFDNNSFQRLGWNVELVSDADGDGAPDLVMGAPEAANLTGTADCGIVYVTPAAATGDVDIRDATYLFGTGTTGRLGDAISNDFDANGDGISDLAMSAPDAGAGAIYIVEGGERAGVYTASSVAVTTITPDPMGGQFDGLDLVATDYDADGNADLIVGAPVPANGQVYLLLGPMTSSVSVEDAETTWVADTLDAILGAAVAVADLDGDGQLDVLMGATGQDATGVAYFQLGKASGTINAADLPRFAGPTDDEYAGLGDGLAVIPDWTGDGKPEVAISAPGWDDVGREGRVYGFLSETIF